MRFFRVFKLELIVLLAVVVVGSVIGWIGAGASADDEPGYEVITDDDLEPFRSAFNANPDHVRLVLLVGPT